VNAVRAIVVVIIRLWAAGKIASSILGLSLWSLISAGPEDVEYGYGFYTSITGGVSVVIGLLASIFAPRLSIFVYSEERASETLTPELGAARLS